MLFSSLILGLMATAGVSALPRSRAPSSIRLRRQEETTNPFAGKKLFVNPEYAVKTESALGHFETTGDTVNAARVRAVQQTGTFVWVSNLASLTNIDAAIEGARAAKEATGEEQIVGLVHYNLPGRDCSAGESAGELDLSEEGLRLYKETYVAPFAEKLAAATDLTFAVVLEPDSLANVITNQEVGLCKEATPVYEEGIAHAISQLQFDHVHLYLDAAHGGWLGWDDNLPLTAKEFAKVVQMAGDNAKIRGLVTNVSNFNPLIMPEPRENYTEWSNSYDESNFALSLGPHLEAEGLPSRFIIDQGRVHVPGARKEWGEWCNVKAGFGMLPGTPVENELIDSVVWVKPGGESDGECGMEGAPRAGQWFEEYFRLLIENADKSLDAAE